MWYLVLSRAARTDEEKLPRMQPHLDWLDELHRAGRVLFSGRTADHDYGIYILLADTLAEATELAAADPYHVHGDRSMQILAWNPQRAMRLDGPSIDEIEAMARQPRS